jgi:hypothetical protein
MTRSRVVTSAVTFDSELLISLDAAFRRRRRAIRYRAGTFAITREIESEFERLNVDLGFFRLSVWADGALWFRVAEPGPSRRGGWTFIFSFHGDALTLAAPDVVSMFERALSCRSPTLSPDDKRQHLLAVWRAVQPVVEKTLD